MRRVISQNAKHACGAAHSVPSLRTQGVRGRLCTCVRRILLKMAYLHEYWRINN